MTIEEFYCKCNNAGWKTVFNIYSYLSPIFVGGYDEMPASIRNMHVGSFQVFSGKRITINVQEMRR